MTRYQAISSCALLAGMILAMVLSVPISETKETWLDSRLERFIWILAGAVAGVVIARLLVERSSSWLHVSRRALFLLNTFYFGVAVALAILFVHGFGHFSLGTFAAAIMIPALIFGTGTTVLKR